MTDLLLRVLSCYVFVGVLFAAVDWFINHSAEKPTSGYWSGILMSGVRWPLIVWRLLTNNKTSA